MIWIDRLLARYQGIGRNAWLYLISNTVAAIAAGALGVIYTLYLSAAGYGTDFIGALAVVATVGGGIGIVPAQWLANRFGWRNLLIWSNLIGGVAIALQLVVPTGPVLVVTSVAVGISVAIYLVINAPLIAANSAPEQRTTLYGLNNALQFLAAIAGSLLGGGLPTVFARQDVRESGLLRALAPLLLQGQQAQAYQLALIVIGLIATPAILPIFFMREPERALGTPGALGTLSTVAAPWAGVRLPSWAQVVAWVRWLAVFLGGTAGRISLVQALVGFGAGIWFPFVNLYFVQQLGVSSFAFGWIASGVTVLMAVASLLAAPLAARLGEIRLAVFGYLGSLPFLLVIGLFPVATVAAAAYLIRGMWTNVAGPPLSTYLMGAVPEESRVVANGVNNVSYQVAWALGALLGGVLVSAADYRPSFFAAAPFYLVGALLLAFWFWRQPTDKKAPALPQEQPLR